MYQDLKNQKCVPCEGGVSPFTPEQIEQTLPMLKTQWRVLDGKKLAKEFEFKNFVEAIEFVNKIAKVAEYQGHHPNLRIHDYKKVEVELFTHKINGLHLNDFILAANIETL